MTEAQRIARLEPPRGKVSMVLDTDAFNEVDDQFAIAYAARAAQEGLISLEAIYAEPFENRGYTYEAGMERSWQEILRILDLAKAAEYKDRVYRGAVRQMRDGQPVPSEAAEDLIRRAMDPERKEPLYVACIGAGTNLASALLMEPAIKERIVVVWLAANCLHWPHVREFNICQDVKAAQVIFDGGVPLVLMPAYNVVLNMTTSVYELEHYLGGKGEIGEYLLQIVRDYAKERENPAQAWSKVIWDVVAPAYLMHPEWFDTRLVTTPILTDDYHWATDSRRPLMRICDYVQRDYIFMDVFNKLAR